MPIAKGYCLIGRFQCMRIVNNLLSEVFLVVFLWDCCRKNFLIAMNLTLGYVSKVLLMGINDALPT